MQNPDIDVSSFLKGASFNFQKYIEDSLAEIERKISENVENTHAVPGANNDNKFGKLMNYFMEHCWK